MSFAPALLIASSAISAVGSISAGRDQARLARRQADAEAANAQQQAELQARSTELESRQASQQLLSSAAALDWQSAELDRYAADVEKVGLFRESQARKAVGRARGANIAALAASGVQISGSALEVLADNAREAELEVMGIRFEIGGEARRARAEAILNRFEAAESRRAEQITREGLAQEAADTRAAGVTFASQARSIGSMRASSVRRASIFEAGGALARGYGQFSQAQAAGQPGSRVPYPSF